MLFSSIGYLFVFLPTVLILYFLCPRRAKNYFLLAASLFFYFTGEPSYSLLLIASALLNYLSALVIDRLPKGRGRAALLAAVVAINIGGLVYFKYAEPLTALVNLIPGVNLPVVQVKLPLGISFYTFQAMSYTIDVYRGDAKLQKNPFAFATYLCLFPQLIAGPIVRYTDVDEELSHRRHSVEQVASGLTRFTVGLAKKVLLANNLGAVCALYRSTEAPSVLFAWLNALCFTLQIYFDFSGYSDMAIGMGRVFGFQFPENFNYPYLSGSVTEFWRRWHMTLSSWFRDYVYIPLGGSRVSKGRWLINLLVVWALTGLWHGSGNGVGNFVLWGAMYGILLCLEKLFLLKVWQKLPALGHIFTLLVTILGFVLFAADGFAGAGADFAALLGMNRLPLTSDHSSYLLVSNLGLLVIAIVAATPLPRRIWVWASGKKAGEVVTSLLQPLLVGIGLLLVTAYLADGSFNPFLYFRF